MQEETADSGSGRGQGCVDLVALTDAEGRVAGTDALACCHPPPGSAFRSEGARGVRVYTRCGPDRPASAEVSWVLSFRD